MFNDSFHGGIPWNRERLEMLVTLITDQKSSWLVIEQMVGHTATECRNVLAKFNIPKPYDINDRTL